VRNNHWQYTFSKQAINVIDYPYRLRNTISYIHTVHAHEQVKQRSKRRKCAWTCNGPAECRYIYQASQLPHGGI
jgi:hypothetical protein